MKPWRRIFTYLVSLPPDLLVGWPCVLLVWLLWGEHLRWEHEALVCQMKPGSWPVNPDKWLGGWYLHRKGKTITTKRGEKVTLKPRAWGGTTPSPHAIFYGPDRDLGGSPDNWTELQRHEHRHVEQGEAMQFMSATIGAVVFLNDVFVNSTTMVEGLRAGLGIWTFGGYILMGVAGWTIAWLRGEQPYRGAFHEEAAYALEDEPPNKPGV